MGEPKLQSFDLLLFGGSGDLAMRKLLPALYFRHREGDLPEHGRIIGLARQELSREDYVAKVRESCARFVPARDFSADVFGAFAQRLDYLQLDAQNVDDFRELGRRLVDTPAAVRVFYLSTSPDLFTTICGHLASAGLIHAQSRVVLEKPLGRDLKSAREIQRAVGAVFEEPQIYRIDHYLGKEPVQNLMALRFGNTLLEPLWDRGSVQDVKITLAEELGVEARGEFYDRAGAARDMVQNHLLQLLCFVAMEPPTSIDADAIRDEKLKVLRSLRTFTEADVRELSVRGQYRAGAVGGKPVSGYLDEPGIRPASTTETYVALRVELENWRWSGVPFYLRTGKRLPERTAQIVINFRSVPHAIFPMTQASVTSNRLVIELQPDESLRLYMMAKVPGDEMQLKPVQLNLDFSEQFKTRPMDAYERLLMDVIRGKLTLFMRGDELDSAWRWIQPILDAWENSGEAPRPYTAGTWGPAAASALVARAGTAWPEEC